jgi:CelD/BcsL family acetyltransferase involved in cellulose biosynthesis
MTDPRPGHTTPGNRIGPHRADAAPAVCSVRIVRTDDAFDALASPWDALLAKSDGTVFQSFEWQRTWWKYFHGGMALNIILFERGEELLGIAPLCAERTRLFGVPVATRLKFIGVGLSDYLWPIIATGHEQVVAEAFASYLKSTQRAWDVIDIEDVSESAACFGPLPDRLAAAGLSVYRYHGTVCPWIPLPATEEEWSAGLGSNASYNLKRKFKRLRANFSSGIELVRGETDGIDAAIDDFSRIHGGRWKSQGHPSAFDDPHHRAFHVEVCRKLAGRDWLRIFFLRVDGERVAVNFSFNYRGRIHMYQSNAHGSEEVMKCSPGLLIRSVAMTEGIREGMRVFDFMRGNEAYKYREWDARESKNWLFRSSSRAPAGRLRFVLFLWAELMAKSTNRLKWEYYEYRRFMLSAPEPRGVWAYIGRKGVSLFRLCADYVSRHLPWTVRSVPPDDGTEGDA